MMRRTAPPAKQAPAVLGEKKMRRVWMKSDPTKGMGYQAKYWYVEAHSREGAINDMARRMRKKAEDFDSVKD